MAERISPSFTPHSSHPRLYPLSRTPSPHPLPRFARSPATVGCASKQPLNRDALQLEETRAGIPYRRRYGNLPRGRFLI